MNRFRVLAPFLLAALYWDVDITVMSSCSAHGIRPQSDTVFCRRCGELHGDEVEVCPCGSDDLLAMCDLCAVEFTKRGRVPVETAN
jgi:hypothetical protein